MKKVYTCISQLFFLVLLINGCTNKTQENKKQAKIVNSDKPTGPATVEVSSNNTWMKSLLDVTKFKNGDSILFCQDEASWTKACENQIPAYSTSSDKSVKYYNMPCVTDQRGIAPEGFKLPTVKEIEDLLISNFKYTPQNTIYRGFNDPSWQHLTEMRAKSKFELFPSGARLSSGDFDEIQNQTTYLWTRTTLIIDGEKGSCEYFTVNIQDVYEGWTKGNTWQTWNQGFPILCLKGNSHDKAGKLIIEEKNTSSRAAINTD
jgi:uncharacterized protein (TIGR02145 family)